MSQDEIINIEKGAVLEPLMIPLYGRKYERDYGRIKAYRIKQTRESNLLIHL